MRSKKFKLVKFLEKRRIVTFDELRQLLGSEATTKAYVGELKRAGVLKYRDLLRLNGRTYVAFFVSHKGLEAYKQELEQKLERKREWGRMLWKMRMRQASEDQM